MTTKAVVLAAIANAILKTVLAVSFGSPALRRQFLVLMPTFVAAGIVGLLLTGDARAVAPSN